MKQQYPEIMKSGFENYNYQKGDKERNHKFKLPKFSKIKGENDLKKLIVTTTPSKVLNADAGDISAILAKDDRRELKQSVISQPNGKLLIDLHFATEVSVSSIIIRAPMYNGPQTVKLFVNCNVGDWILPWQGAAYITTLNADDLCQGATIILGSCRNFKRIKSLQLEVQTNQTAQGLTNLAPTVIRNLSIYGRSRQPFLDRVNILGACTNVAHKNIY